MVRICLRYSIGNGLSHNSTIGKFKKSSPYFITEIWAALKLKE